MPNIANSHPLTKAIRRTFTPKADLWILGTIWLLGALCDRLWLIRDRAVPAWDQTHHLTGSLNYLHALQNAQWFSQQWWRNLWMLSSKNPPFPYIATAPFQQLFGKGPDEALWVMLLWSGLLLLSIYTLGKQLFNRQVGLLAAFISTVIPGMYVYRLQYLIDYPLTAFVAATFCCLTMWRESGFSLTSNPANPTSETSSFSKKTPKTALLSSRFSQTKGKVSLFLKKTKDDKSFKQWSWAIALGISLGLSILTKQAVIFFLFIPLCWTFFSNLWRRAWGRIAQLIVAFGIAAWIFFPWYSINWIYFIGNYQSGIAAAAVREGDPPLNTLGAWTYYFQQLPHYYSFPLLVIPIAGLLLSAIKIVTHRPARKSIGFRSLFWLALFLIGSYLLCSALVNKDTRYILPALPIFSLILAKGLLTFRDRVSWVRWSILGLIALPIVLNLFPTGATLATPILRPLELQPQFPPYTGAAFPHTEIVQEIIQTSPQLQATVGVMPVTPEINHNNFNYYGAIADFQVYGREVGVRERHVQQDARSLDWFLTKTGDRGTDRPANEMLVTQVEQSPDFALHKTWQFPDNSTLKLYHRNPAAIAVTPAEKLQTSLLPNNATGAKIQLKRVVVPQTAPPGQPVPVTYTWFGPWQQLQSAIVLVTWKRQGTGNDNQVSTWLHDRALGNGQLYSGQLTPQQQQQPFQVTEKTAMLPPATTLPGIYTLEATYLNRNTGEHYPIPVPAITLQIDANAAATPAPELDLVTQLRNLAAQLPQGIPALEGIFDEIGRINQYDPVQDYTEQAELALSYRLETEGDRLQWFYALAFARALQEEAEGAIAALEKVAQLDSQNPYAHAYLAFVYLYDGQAKAAQRAIEPAIALQPNSLELQAIEGVAALMQGNFVKAWRVWQAIAPLII
ncbi:MAG: phospholipid carrier-dependent glycosyltransferase [Cyanobacteriota bacterium]|nr:phospholipid carrier-dependent glycosyltransferase [Cyanobacteriota bacterium]